MSLFSKNVHFGAPIRLSAFRKVALGTWKTVGDPSVYSSMEIDVGPAMAYIDKLNRAGGTKITITHFFGKAVAETIRRHPDINCVLRLGRLYARQTVDVFFQVASDKDGKDLSGSTIRDADKKSVLDLAGEMQKQVTEIRTKNDPAYKKMKATMKMIPGWLAGTMINLTGFIMYTLNLWSPLFGMPRDPFGSVMITNVGSLGLDWALVPLVPYSRVPLLLAVGAIQDQPIIKEGKIVVASILKVGVTLDHRVIDGIHASHMSKTLKKIFQSPEKELG